MKLLEMILSEMSNVSKPQKKFMMILITTIIGAYSKINFRSLSRLSGIAEKTFRRWFKAAFDFSEFNSKVIDKVVKQENDDVVAAFDQSFDSKAGKMTWGKDYFWNGCASKAEKGLELVLCAIIDLGKNTAYSLVAEQTPPIEKKIDKKISKNITKFTRMNFYLSCIEKWRLKILKYTKYFAFDGYFSKKKFVDGIVDMGFHFIGKLRCDADLKILYVGEQKKGRGRPKKFAGKCNISELQGFSFERDIDDKTKLYSGIFYHASLERKVKVVAIRYINKDKVGTALLFSTDLGLDSFKIFSYYKARFQIEFVFRDAKQYLGLADCQSRNKESLHFHYNASFAALNLVKVQEVLDHINDEKYTPFSMASHKARYHNENLIDRFFSKLAPGITLIKSSPLFREAVNYGAIIFR